ncbi:MAG TPA: NifB/NifX family molybdenum-iron cluster-binding protein [Thermotogota bacterium]|mgnify:CR=1 FL=1|nr:NifB/NifX family molybdenum-iron cluster-binding protein [Thermotogota bacterium]HRW91739.1 NifB/NifX family molybdenum-iron cluster-binding protein [Thermotogota bacterium]
MKILISSETNDNNAPVSSRLARAEFFLLLDSASGESEWLPNPFSMEHGMGPKVAQMAADFGVKRIYSAPAGPNAKEALDSLGIDVFSATGKTVQQVIDEVRNENV